MTIEKQPGKFWATVVDRPWTMVGVSLFLLCLSCIGLTQLSINNNPRVYFSDTDEEYQRFVDLEKDFNVDDVVIFIFKPESGDVFSRDNLAVIEEITEKSWLLPHVTRVDSLANFQHTRVDGDELTTDNLYQGARELTSEQLAEIKSIALNEVGIVKRTLSEQGHVATVWATVQMDEQQSQAREIITAARALKAELADEIGSGEIMLGGSVIIGDSSQAAIEESFGTVMPLATLVAIILLALLLRSFYAIAMTMTVVGLSVTFAMGVAGILNIELSPIAGLAPSMILTLAIADCVHVLVTYRQKRADGIAHREAMVESLQVNFKPIWVTSFTTGIGFALLNFAEAAPLHAMGSIVAIGVFAAFYFAVVFLPAVMTLLPEMKVKPVADSTSGMTRLAEFIIDKKNSLLSVGALLAVVLVSCMSLNKVDDVFFKYFDESFEFRRNIQFYMDNVGGLQQIQVVIPSEGSQGVMAPEYLRNVEKLADYLRSHKDVSHVMAFPEVIKRLNRNMHGDNPDFYSVPDDRALISQYTLMYELSLPMGLGLDNQVNMDKSSSILRVFTEPYSSAELVALKQEIDTWIDQNFPAYMQTEGSGLDYLFGRITFNNVESMISGNILAFISITLLLALIFGSVRYGLLSLLPNVLPALMAFGVWGLINGEVGVMVSIVTCLTLGIVVDDTVHLVSKYLRARRELGMNPEDAVRYSVKTVGIALAGTTLILAGNFMVIATSSFYPNASMGALAAITIIIAWLVDFFLFLPLLLTLDKKRYQEETKGEELPFEAA